MKKIALALSATLLLLANSCQKQDQSLVPSVAIAPDPTELDRFIQNKLIAEGQFLWSWATDEMVWTALSNSDHVLSVGYQPAGFQNLDARIHEINFQTPEWRAARAEALRIVLEEERKLNPEVTEQSLFAFAETQLPFFNVYVRNPATISALRQAPVVRYAEPIGYEPFMKQRAADRSGSGCDSNSENYDITTPAHYTNLTPGTKLSWNYSFHNIPQAWETSTGSGVKIMVIDTGCSSDQENLGEDLNQGFSSGRSIEKYVTMPQSTIFGIPYGPVPTVDDDCGHGTSMLGACGGPRGIDGNTTGIAYNCNLASVHATEDVYIDASKEVTGVTNAFILAANNSSVRIVSISLGRLTSVSQMTDAINLANNNGKLIFAAAGTSFSWTAWFVGVIYPASLSACVAVTGIQDNLTTKCDACHVGSKVDFVMVMEKASDGFHPLSLPDSGDWPSTVGGSSVSTSSTAGIAALVWSKYPGWNKTQVYNRLRNSANYYPNRNSKFGWGRINAQLATQ